MKDIFVEGQTLPEAYHKGVAALFSEGQLADCSDWNLKNLESYSQLECRMTLHVGEPLREPRISKLIICGKGPEKARIEKLIRKRNLGDKIEMRGYVSEEEKAHLMGSCKFFVMPSLFESFGLAAVEVMSYGRPMICTNVNGLSDTVRDGGIIIPPKDPKALSDAMNRLLDDKGERKKLAKAARAQAEIFNWNENIAKIEDVYKKVIG